MAPMVLAARPRQAGRSSSASSLALSNLCRPSASSRASTAASLNNRHSPNVAGSSGASHEEGEPGQGIRHWRDPEQCPTENRIALEGIHCLDGECSSRCGSACGASRTMRKIEWIASASERRQPDCVIARTKRLGGFLYGDDGLRLLMRPAFSPEAVRSREPRNLWTSGTDCERLSRTATARTVCSKSDTRAWHVRFHAHS